MTEIHVGVDDELVKFLVHKKLVARHSEFLAKALRPDSDWKEVKENVIRLPEP